MCLFCENEELLKEIGHEYDLRDELCFVFTCCVSSREKGVLFQLRRGSNASLVVDSNGVGSCESVGSLSG